MAKTLIHLAKPFLILAVPALVALIKSSKAMQKHQLTEATYDDLETALTGAIAGY